MMRVPRVLIARRSHSWLDDLTIFSIGWACGMFVAVVIFLASIGAT